MSFWLIPLLILKSLATLVVLLVFVAYILYADRKIWAAVQLRRGPNVVGPWGLFQSFADLIKFVLKEPIIPAGANKGVFLLAPFVMGMLALAAWGGDPGGGRVGGRQPQRRHALHLRDLVAVGLRRDQWAVGPRTRNIRFCRRCARPPRWCPTRSRSAS